MPQQPQQQQQQWGGQPQPQQQPFQQPQQQPYFPQQGGAMQRMQFIFIFIIILLFVQIWLISNLCTFYNSISFIFLAPPLNQFPTQPQPFPQGPQQMTMQANAHMVAPQQQQPLAPPPTGI